ncbi:MTH1175-like domain-containing protein [Lachnospiraceae bacterium KM106-2]|nr:MTH1175-like domain-containing protein [Lachnospiraceae bacterium KM106-2]
MKIAVTYENGQVFQHFGHTSQFQVFEVENNQIKDTCIVDTNGSGHGALAGFLENQGVEALICGGIGGGAIQALKEASIQVFGGVSGATEEAVKAFLEGKLNYNPNVRCSHHDHEHGEGHHTCGDHGCGNH